jgi:hypothetical protein
MSREAVRKRTGTSEPWGSARIRSHTAKAVDVRHPDVEEDAVGSLPLERREPFRAPLREDDAIPLILERILGQQTVGLVVVDDENPCTIGP